MVIPVSIVCMLCAEGPLLVLTRCCVPQMLDNSGTSTSGGRTATWTAPSDVSGFSTVTISFVIGPGATFTALVTPLITASFSALINAHNTALLTAYITVHTTDSK